MKFRVFFELWQKKVWPCAQKVGPFQRANIRFFLQTKSNSVKMFRKTLIRGRNDSWFHFWYFLCWLQEIFGFGTDLLFGRSIKLRSAITPKICVISKNFILEKVICLVSSIDCRIRPIRFPSTLMTILLMILWKLMLHGEKD